MNFTIRQSIPRFHGFHYNCHNRFGVFPPDPNESNCNITIKLTSEMRFASVSSPGFPQPYPDNQDCNTNVEVPRGYQIEVEFEELMLENEST